MKPTVLDLFCGAGGAGKGYADAGFRVVGIDIRGHPNYPFEFVQGDAIRLLQRPEHRKDLSNFHLIHASPPCQAYSTVSGKSRKNGKTYVDLIAQTRQALQEIGVPYVIENVVNAPLINPVMLCGSSFGLDVRRHRLFETSFPLDPVPCNHGWQTPRFRSLDARMVKAGRLASVVGVHGNCNYSGEFELRCKAMGIDWMTNAELTQAIPPAYTRYIGRQFLEGSLREGS